jgi:hypothetical protein
MMVGEIAKILIVAVALAVAILEAAVRNGRTLATPGARKECWTPILL